MATTQNTPLFHSVSPTTPEAKELFPWQDKTGFEIIRTFIAYLTYELPQKTESQKLFDEAQIKYPYLFKYAKRYNLLSTDESTRQKVSELATTLCQIDPNNEKEVAIYLKSLLEKNREGCGEWIVNKDSIMNTQRYIFEANYPTDASYQYALFLNSLGILEMPEEWILENKSNLYFCKLTRQGQQLWEILNSEMTQSFAPQIQVEGDQIIAHDVEMTKTEHTDISNNNIKYDFLFKEVNMNSIDLSDHGDYSTHVGGSVFGQMTGGKNNSLNKENNFKILVMGVVIILVILLTFKYGKNINDVLPIFQNILK